MNKFLTYLAFAALILSACGTEKNAVEQQSTISKKDHPYIEKFHKAIRYKATGRIDEAINVLNECLLIRQDDDAVYYALSELELMRDNEDLAASHILKASEIDPDNIWYTQEIAYMYFKQQNFVKSAEYFKKLTDKEPRNVDWMYGYAETLMRTGQLEKAVEALNKTEDQVGLNPQISIQKYELYMEAKKETEALKELTEARKTFPKDPQLIATMVDHYFQKGDQIKATQMLEELVEADPQNGRARLALAEFQQRQGKTEEAHEGLKMAFNADDVDIDTKMRLLINFQETGTMPRDKLFDLVEIMLEKYPEEAKAHSIHGDYLLGEGREKESLMAYKKALEFDKSEFPIWNQVLIMEYQQRMDKELYEDSKECLTLFPTISTVYLLNGVSANQLKKYDEAIEVLSLGRELVVNDKPLDAEFVGQLAEANFGLKDYEEGKRLYRSAISMDGQSLLLKNNFARRLANSGQDLELAVSLMEQVLERAPGQAAFLDNYGWVLFQQGKYEEAQKFFEDAQEKEPMNAEIVEHLGDVAFKLNDLDKAMLWWKNALDIDGDNTVLRRKLAEKKYYAPED